jgi:hypothetical protein
MVHQWVTQGMKRSIDNAQRPGRGSMMRPTINEESDCLRKKICGDAIPHGKPFDNCFINNSKIYLGNFYQLRALFCPSPPPPPPSNLFSGRTPIMFILRVFLNSSLFKFTLIFLELWLRFIWSTLTTVNVNWVKSLYFNRIFVIREWLLQTILEYLYYIIIFEIVFNFKKKRIWIYRWQF